MKNKWVYVIIGIIIILAISLVVILKPKNSTNSPSEYDTTTEQNSETEETSEPDSEKQSSEIASELPSDSALSSENPTDTEKPVTPEQPTESEEPTTSEDPAPSEKPTESEKPSEKPTESEKPSESQKPSESDTSTENPGGNGDVSTEPVEPEKPKYTYKDLDKTMYATGTVNVRDLPTSDGKKLGSLTQGAEVKVTGQCNETNWYRIDFDGKVAYVSNKYLTDEKPVEEEPEDNDGLPSGYSWDDRDGDGFADLPDFTEMGGMMVKTRDITPEMARFAKQISEAGLNVVMEFKGNYYVLASTSAEARATMDAWLKERGLKRTNGSGGNWDKYETVKFFMVIETREYFEVDGWVE